MAKLEEAREWLRQFQDEGVERLLESKTEDELKENVMVVAITIGHEKILRFRPG